MHKYYETDNITLYLGDCMNGMDQLGPVDMIFADPPYLLSNGGFTYHGGQKKPVHKGAWDISRGHKADLQFTYNWLAHARHTLTDDGTLWVTGTYHNLYKTGYCMNRLGYHTLNEIIWSKPNASINLSRRMFTAAHETIIWAKRDSASRHTFNYHTMKLMNQGRQMRSVWQINSTGLNERRFGSHPTQKPVELLRRIILASTNPGDLILDPFNGSGTTGLVAASLGRRYIGIDIEPEYLETTIRRINALSQPKGPARSMDLVAQANSH